MIKKLFWVILFGFSFSLFAQQENLSAADKQKYFFEEGEKALKERNFNRAYSFFFGAQNGNTPDKEIVSKSIKKTDSLKVIIRAEQRQKIIGNWKLLTPDSWAMRDPSDSIVGKMITIDADQILFYELYDKAKKWNLAKTEKIIFSDKENLTSDPLLIVYSNKEVWRYYIDETSGSLSASYIGEENENGIAELLCVTTQLKYFKLQ